MSLRIVCCYVPGLLQQRTWVALEHHAAETCDIEMVELPAEDDRAYGAELRDQWDECVRESRALAIVEQDVVVRADVIEAFLNDPDDYVCFPYAWLTDVGPALGCTRFSAKFIRSYPNLIEEATWAGVGWQQLDVVIMRHLLARRYGEQPKVLLPPVEHLNEKKQLLPDASPEPLMEVPHW